MIKPIKDMFNFLIYAQTFMFLMFVIENINNLDSIYITFGVSDQLQATEINFYDLIAATVGIMLIAILLGINFLGSGLNSESIKLAAKYLAYSVVMVMYFLATIYFLGSLGWIGIVLEIFAIIVYALEGLNMMLGNDGEAQDDF